MPSSRTPEAPPSSIVSAYEGPLTPWLFNLAMAAIFAPFGGARRLRTQTLDLSGIGAGTRVLELGCGTGGITALMLARGADVLGVDGSEQMLSCARRRAPAARFERAQFEELSIARTYDVILLAFVLHELGPALRSAVLAKALAALEPAGRLAILDHSVPAERLFGPVWRRMLRLLEPAAARDCIDKGYEGEVEAAGGRVEAVHRLAAGTASLTLVTAPSRARADRVAP